MNDSSSGQSLFDIWQDFSPNFIFYMDLSLGFVFYSRASCERCPVSGRRRVLDPEHLVVLLAGPFSHTSTQYMDFVEVFNISLDLSTIYFAYFSGY